MNSKPTQTQSGSDRVNMHFPTLPPNSQGLTRATWFLNYDDPLVGQFVNAACIDHHSSTARAVALFYAVRDQIRYDPYQIRLNDRAYRASQVIADGHGWCVSKAGLLAACLRAVNIPAAIGLADVKNHLTSAKLRARMGTDIFYDHGYVAACLNGIWLKLVPAFNIELCERFGVRPTEFDGSGDALYQQFDTQNRQHMQYLADHGTWSDLPLDRVRADFRQHYPGIVEQILDAPESSNVSDPFGS